MHKFTFLVAAAISCAALADDCVEELVVQDLPNAWHFRVGPVMSPRVRARVRGPRQTMPARPVSGVAASGTAEGNVVPAPSAGYADRQYADGYVKPDEGTSDPDSMISGLTWNWGADDVSAQYSDGKMEFRTGVARWEETGTASSFSEGSGSESDRDMLVGVEAMGGWTFFENDTFDAAIEGGFRFYGSGDLSSKSRYGTSVTKTRNEYRFVDSYDASGWTDVPRGSYTGSAGGPGRLIGATPTRREELAGSTALSETQYHEGSTKLNYRIWDVRVGPTIGWKAASRLTIRGGVYGLVGLVDAKLSTTASTAEGARRASRSSCEAVFGMAAGLSAQINLSKNIFITGGAEYDWWSDTVGLKAGGAEAKLKLSDVTMSLALGIEF